MKRILDIILVLVAIAISTLNLDARKKWVGTWATAEQVVEPHNCPPEPGLGNNSIRQIVQVSIGGDKIRLKFSNEFSKTPVTINAAAVSHALTAGYEPDVEAGSMVYLTFKGKSSVTIKPGELVTSDPIKYHLDPRDNVAIDIQFGAASSTDVTGHPGSRTTSYIATGNTTDFTNAVRTDHWYIINAIETESKDGKACAIAVMGDSITDGRGSTTNMQNRWTDVLSRKLLADESTKDVAVLNFGLGGNCVLRGGLGPTVKDRYERDLLGQEGVRYIIIFEGVNDLGGRGDATDKAKDIIKVYKDIIKKAHKKDILVYGATVAPFKGNNYYSKNHEEGRKILNDWILYGGEFDGVIDFASIAADPSDKEQLNPKYLYENDWLHPNAQGYNDMGKSIDIKLFNK
ncbi:MAG: SGNH/GDSL hydrolase family protein [Bacteroidales bacterium]|nr:SGNH/GDSL hydrolase family protein [Bacteroidales bacterium]